MKDVGELLRALQGEQPRDLLGELLRNVVEQRAAAIGGLHVHDLGERVKLEPPRRPLVCATVEKVAEGESVLEHLRLDHQQWHAHSDGHASRVFANCDQEYSYHVCEDPLNMSRARFEDSRTNEPRTQDTSALTLG